MPPTETNRETTIARWFHADTSYVMDDVVTNGERDILMGDPEHRRPAIGDQDLAIEPNPYKQYHDLPIINLPAAFPDLALPALAAIRGDRGSSPEPFDLELVARLCLRSCGLLKRWTNARGKTFEFRAAGCTGARYHVDLYLVTGELPGLPAGVYHYAPDDHRLRELRRGDFRATLAAATGDYPAVAGAPVTAVLTSTWWRNAWRYQERTYRHAFWDAATISANMIALANAADRPAEMVLGFVDDAVNRLIGVDGDKEAALVLLPLGEGAPVGPPVDATLIAPRFDPPSAREIDFPGIRRMHDASSLPDGDAARDWRLADDRSPAATADSTSGTRLIPLRPELAAGGATFEAVVRARRSNRHYDADAVISFAALSTMLDAAITAAERDRFDSGPTRWSPAYLIVNNVESLAPGTYLVHERERALELLKPGEFRSEATDIGCEQDYAGAAQVNFYLLADLDGALARFGNRGYRVAQFEAALFGARLQLEAHALGLGAVGLTSVDAEVIDFFSPSAAGRDFMFVALAGVRRRPNRDEQARSTGFIKTAPSTSE